MKGRIFLSILFTLIVVGLLAGLGVVVYNQGVANGLAANGNVTITTPGMTAPYVHPGYLFHPWGWGFGFFPFGFLIGLFFLFLIIGGIRRLFFPGAWHRGYYGGMGMHHQGYGPRGFGPYGFDPEHDQVPPIVEQWHRKMHEEPQGKAPEEGAGK